MSSALRSFGVVILVIAVVVGGIFLFDGFSGDFLPSIPRITSWTTTCHAEAYVIGRRAMGEGQVYAQVNNINIG